jgi:hypothetical protein
MGKWKVLAILFGLFSVGAVQELFRIMTSDAPDIAPNRRELIPIAFGITLVFFYLTARFWRKASAERSGRL